MDADKTKAEPPGASGCESSFCQLFEGVEDWQPRLWRKETSLPESLEDGEVIAKILLATICGSDLHTLAGKRREPTPSVLGHEAVAEVVRSSNAQHPAGQRITFSVFNSCGNCERCHDNLPQKCTSLMKYGHNQFTAEDQLSGCYASHILLRRGTTIVPVPADLPDAVAAPANCALATMVHAVESLHDRGAESPSERERTALVQGAGLLGIYGVVLLKDRGYSTVYCTDVDQRRLDMVERFGAVPVLMQKDTVMSQLIKPNSVDAVFEVCGQKKVLSDGLESLRYGGTYVLVGLVHPDSTLPFTAEGIIRKCATIKGIHNYNSEHLRMAVAFLARSAHLYPYHDLVSTPYALTDIVQAVDVAAQQAFHRVALQP